MDNFDYKFDLSRSKSKKDSSSALHRIRVYQDYTKMFDPIQEEYDPQSTNQNNLPNLVFQHNNLFLESQPSSRLQQPTAEEPEQKPAKTEPIVKKESDSDEEDAPDDNDKKLEHVGKVVHLLKKLFKKEKTSLEDFQMSDNEKRILGAIILRKYDEVLTNLDDEHALYKTVNDIIRRESKKRPEENYKFVFKRVIKAMREKYKSKMEKSKVKKKMSEKSFYEHYFKKLAEKNKWPLERYYHPRNSNSNRPNFHKTINTEYIKSISESPEFMMDFMHEMNLLEERCKHVIDSKLRSLALRFEEIYEKNPAKGTEEIIHYITKNKKCKLPWTNNEVQEAVEVVQKLFSERT